MWEHMKFKSDRNAGSYLAAYFIFALGMVAISTFALFTLGDHPEAAYYILGILFALTVLSLVLRRIDLPSNRWMGIFGRGQESSNDYVPQRRRPKSLDYGTNRPPTVEDLRDAADGPNNWVPSGSPSGRRSIRKR